MEIQNYDICVIGGGLAGMCAAVSAARSGAKVVLIHDRPVFGGNCSSEIRMWPLGAHGLNRRETGIFEELVLENMHRNPMRNFSIWDSVLYGLIKNQQNLTSHLNCTVIGAETKDDSIVSVEAWQLTTYKRFKITADIFIDCSGDSILAEFTGAEYRFGREAKAEFGEEAAPVISDRKTMGSSCLIQAREVGRPVKYIPPDWARSLPTDSMLKERNHRPDLLGNNYWWMELGGEQDCIKDNEEIRDELVKLEFGVWDHIKNQGGHDAENWELDFAGFLPGKRESRRYVGDHILNQSEVAAGGKFDDIIAYGGWKIDDHPPAGFEHNGAPTKYYDCPSPFGIPYRCIYSVNVKNLMFAGRNISVTHAAMAASRVMATCAMLGQAAGTAAAMALEYSTDPRGICQHIDELQQRLMENDCWLPGKSRRISDICKNAELTAGAPDAENLRNGRDRPTDEEGDNGCTVELGSEITYTLKKSEFVKEARIVFDSDLNRKTINGGIDSAHGKPMICNRPFGMEPFTFPTTMVDCFELLADGEVVFRKSGNYQRLLRIPVERSLKSLTLRVISTTGSEKAHIFSFDFK